MSALPALGKIDCSDIPLRSYAKDCIDLDPNTLTLYLVAAGLSMILSLVMAIFAHFHPGTHLIRAWVFAILTLAAGYFVAGIGPLLPRWVTVIGSNMLLLSASTLMYSGFVAYSEDRNASPDRWGWLGIALTLPAFWYWGLIEPNGHYRSMVFSAAAALLNGRTALVLLHAARNRIGGLPLRGMAILFWALVLSMVARIGILIVTDPTPPDLRGANPTEWTTVFWYVALISAMSVGAMWMEVHRRETPPSAGSGDERGGLSAFVADFPNKLLLLWITVIVMVTVITGVLGVAYANFQSSERERLEKSVELVNNALVEQTRQVVQQIDTTLHAVRGFYRRTRSIAETEAFIDAISFDRSVIDNIYLISPDGRAVISHDPATMGRSVANREYFKVLQSATDDRIIIAPVERGLLTGRFHFRVVRRIDAPDGGFGGMVTATVIPESFARYYDSLTGGSQHVAALLSIADRKFRARVPELPPAQWSIPVESPLWEVLEHAATGKYENVSPVDYVRRTYFYKQVPDLPLVMVTGFSDAEVTQNVHGRMLWLVMTAGFILGFGISLALLLTIEAKRRDEQDRLMSMLSHELKTPLSVIGLSLSGVSLPDGIKERVVRAVGAIKAVVERCLQTDRLQHGRFAVRAESCRIEAVLNDVAIACGAPQRLVIEIGDLPEFTTDVQLLSVILGNLIDNALKYGAHDAQVRVVASRAGQKGRMGIRVDVTNAPGRAGMPDARQVFRKYYRAPGAHGKTGSGLGLHIAAGFAHKLGGVLNYRPAADKVQFELWIPL